MKAITFQGVNHVEVKNVEDSTIMKADDIIIKVTSTTICGSDLHLLHGSIPKMPKGFIIGHEAMGVVEEWSIHAPAVRRG
ncbi:alcohol dehydrogenase catalytic domain-containing protein [Desulfosporosinus sp. FKA]